MKKFIFVLILGAFFASTATVAIAKRDKGDDWVTINHNTGNGFVVITVKRSALLAHLAHGDTEVDDGGC